MNFSHFRQLVKPWMLPIAMLVGIVFHDCIGAIAFLSPYLIFVMLLIAFCKMKVSRIALTGLQRWLLAVQILGALLAYFLLLPVSPLLAQGAFICIFCPTATAAPVITSMLGGSIENLISYSLLSNVAVALLAPFFFSMMGSAHMAFSEQVATIAMKVVPLILSPMLVAVLLRHTVPAAHRVISEHQSLSFYIWAVSLIIVVGNAVSFIVREPASAVPLELALAGVSLAACLLQFGIGRRIGRRFGHKIVGAQGLGQKNTVLAVWMAFTYFNPVTSVAPAAYVAWQNIINSLQLYFRLRRDSKSHPR